MLILFCTAFATIGMNALTTTEKQIDTGRKIKLDVISIYNTFFDIRRQLRMGIEFQAPLELKRKITKISLSHNLHMDIGQFDHYKYIKYHDFFNTQGGFYAIENDVRTFGGHLIYGVKCNFNRPAHKKLRYFSGLLLDLQLFKKHIRTTDERNNQKSTDNYRQLRLGIGNEYGIEIPIFKRLSLELKAAVLAGIFTVKSRSDAPLIKPYKAMWYDVEQRFWLIPRLNICYAL